MAVFAAKALLMRTHAHLNKDKPLADSADQLLRKRSMVLKNSEAMRQQRDHILGALQTKQKLRERRSFNAAASTAVAVAHAEAAVVHTNSGMAERQRAPTVLLSTDDLPDAALRSSAASSSGATAHWSHDEDEDAGAPVRDVWYRLGGSTSRMSNYSPSLFLR